VFPPDRTQDATPGDSENRPPTGPSEALAISAAALRR
jgi:hypothetical protein